MTDILDVIKARRSIRHYEDKPVAREDLLKLLEAAMAAPTACNSQPWDFVVIDEPEGMAALRGALRFGPYNAPAAIVVCGNPERAHNAEGRKSGVQDCSAATENILIAATGLGLGTVWIGIYPLPSVIKPVAKLLELPEDVTPLCAVYIGYPAEQKRARTQYDAYHVYWQRWEPRKKRAKLKNAKNAD